MRLKAFYLFTIFWSSHACLAQAREDCERLTPGNDAIVAWYAGLSVRTGTAPGRITHRQHAEPDSPLPETDAPDYVWETQYGPLRAIAVISNDEIQEPRNTVLIEGQTMSNVMDVETRLALTDVYSLVYLFRPGIAWCVFSAATDPSDVEPNTLFTNDPAFRLRPPTELEQERFNAYIYPRSYCGNHAGRVLIGIAPEDVPPCDEPQLIGMSDFDGNRNTRFWATEVLRYSTGIAVYDGRSYEKVFSACPGCSD
jgi:hypothetical protein